MNIRLRDEYERENAALIKELSSFNDPIAQELTDRLKRCRHDRVRRRKVLLLR